MNDCVLKEKSSETKRKNWAAEKNDDNLLLSLILTQMNLFYIDVESSVTIFPILLGFGACWHDVVDYGS